MNTTISGLINAYRRGEIQESEATNRILHICFTNVHEKIEEFEASEHHQNGIPVSDLFESEILLPSALALE
jgi:hypothetical protein